MNSKSHFNTLCRIKYPKRKYNNSMKPQAKNANLRHGVTEEDDGTVGEGLAVNTTVCSKSHTCHQVYHLRLGMATSSRCHLRASYRSEQANRDRSCYVNYISVYNKLSMDVFWRKHGSVFPAPWQTWGILLGGNSSDVNTGEPHLTLLVSAYLSLLCIIEKLPKDATWGYGVCPVMLRCLGQVEWHKCWDFYTSLTAKLPEPS